MNLADNLLALQQACTKCRVMRPYRRTHTRARSKIERRAFYLRIKFENLPGASAVLTILHGNRTERERERERENGGGREDASDGGRVFPDFPARGHDFQHFSRQLDENDREFPRFSDVIPSKIDRPRLMRGAAAASARARARILSSRKTD